jgi:energy-coupling factor transporter transmembrane protein EcfT
MARKPVPRFNVAVGFIVAFALVIVAIIVRHFWLSLILGIAGAGTIAYAVLLLREYRKSLTSDEKGVP